MLLRRAESCALDDIVRKQMELNADLVRGLYIFIVFFIAIVTIVFFFQRYRWRRRKRMGKSNWGFYPSSASMGNALQTLSTMALPQAEYVFEEKAKDDADEDDDGGPDDPTAHLHWQADRIRRGEKLDRLTLRRRS
jgi:hypothetical protein